MCKLNKNEEKKGFLRPIHTHAYTDWTHLIGLLAMSGTDGLFCGGLELLTWLLPSPFDRLLLLFKWLPRGFNDDDVEVEEDELFDWYEGFIRLLSLSGGVSRRVGGTMDARLCFTFTFLPISVWFGFISLVLYNVNLLKIYYFFFFLESLTIYFCDFLRLPSYDVWWLHRHHRWRVSASCMVWDRAHRGNCEAHLSGGHIRNCRRDPPCPPCWTGRIWMSPSHRKMAVTTPEKWNFVTIN